MKKLLLISLFAFNSLAACVTVTGPDTYTVDGSGCVRM